MRPLRRPTKSTIYYLGCAHDLGRTTVTMSINGVRWDYTMSAQQCDTVEYLAHKVSVGKALAFAKSHASKAVCHDLTGMAEATFLRHRGAQASRAKRLKVSLADV